MGFARQLIVLAAAYSAIQAVIYLFLATLSILSYYCIIESPFTLTKVSYLIHLKYFKSQHCKNEVDWSYLGAGGNYSNIQPVRNETTAAIERTFAISIYYIFFNVFLLGSCALLYLKRNNLPNRQLISCLVMSLPFILSSVSIFFLDTFAGAHYSVDYARSFTIDGSLTVMEIQNRNEIRPILEQVESKILTLAPAIMMYTSLKFLVFFVLNILLIISILPSVWDALSENKKKRIINDRNHYYSRLNPTY